MSDDADDHAIEMHARDAAATTVHTMAALMDALTRLTAKAARIEALVEQVALGLGIDVAKY